MNIIHAEGYKEAMQVEYETILSKHAWTEVKREKWMNVVPSTSAFKCKRYPAGSVRKLKARFCVCGDKQVEGVDYFDNYAPVVTWKIVRILLILLSILGLTTTQVDYTAALVHADVGEDVYIKISEAPRTGPHKVTAIYTTVTVCIQKGKVNERVNIKRLFHFFE
jgi:hypothetical protein